MNIQKAIESGKKFRRPSWEKSSLDFSWLTSFLPNYCTLKIIVIEKSGQIWQPKVEDLLSNDWEIECDHPNVKTVATGFECRICNAAVAPAGGWNKIVGKEFILENKYKNNKDENEF